MPTPWALFRTPTLHPPRAIGGYSAGCIDGAVALPLRGVGFRVAKPERHRIFGHPLLVDMIRDLGKHLLALHLPPLSVGDLGQPRGGPAPTGHASHQTGLDVDLWFLPPVAGQALSMVDRARMQPSPRFTAKVMRMLMLAASDVRVERIFVNPILKRAMCERTAGAADRSWLHKLRPWWGHDDHFHVRLACPADSPQCTPQAPLPPGDGCDRAGVVVRRQGAGGSRQGPPDLRGQGGRRTRAARGLPHAARFVDDEVKLGMMRG